ncbi:unnamed protein product, partial [Rotaria sp. Silwood1]
LGAHPCALLFPPSGKKSICPLFSCKPNVADV